MPRNIKKPTYTPLLSESQAYLWCMRNNYVIYPVELKPMTSNYQIHMELGHKHAILSEIYTNSTLWKAFYKLCVRIKDKGCQYQKKTQ
tara:strand:- start:4736 stop:4999 length:264 start_codon:yes stop_codon:yes gene_type:complete